MLYLQFPDWIKPEVIPGLPVPLRWYAVMYLVAFAIAYFLFQHQAKKVKLTDDKDLILGYFFWAIMGVIIGARLFGTLVYDTTGIYREQPWLIFWPFDQDMRLTGFAGMSYHGGVVGVIVALLIYCKVKKIDFLRWGDLLAYSIPLGYTFGRIGNFINQELWGRVSALPWAMVFPQAPGMNKDLPWVKDMATRNGFPLPEGADVVNLPRHPSQLYEALFEGVVLWAIMWFIIRPREKIKGAAIAWYLIGYGFIRFLLEYTREPDKGIGYVINWGPADAPTALFVSFLNISTGQIFCFFMILAGVILYLIFRHRASLEPTLAGFAMSEQKRVEARKSRRKTRKKLG